MGAELGDGPSIIRRISDDDEEETTDLHGRILNLLERGRRKEAVRLYHDALGGDIKVAEAAIEELAKNVEFAEVRPAAPARSVRARDGREATSWFSGCVAAIKTLMRLDRG